MNDGIKEIKQFLICKLPQLESDIQAIQVNGSLGNQCRELRTGITALYTRAVSSENFDVLGHYKDALKQLNIIEGNLVEKQDKNPQDGFKPIPESLTPTKTPQQSIIVKPAENKTFMQKALNVLDLAGDVYTAYKISSWGCGILADMLGLDKYALSGIDYVLDMGKNYLTNLLNAPKQVKELTAKVEEVKAQKEELKAVVEEVTTQKEELKSQFDETVGKLQEETTQKEELKAVVEEVKAEKEDLQIQLAEKAKDFTKCTAEVCKLTKENSILSKTAVIAVSIALLGFGTGVTKFCMDFHK